MKLIVGLGNHGKKYEETRHNLGFMVVDSLIQNAKFNPDSIGTKFKVENKFKAEILETECNSEKIILVKPLTYMNNSGMAVSLISQYLNIPISDIWIVHDDIDLLLGAMKIRLGGASAGHKGVESIIKSLGTDKFWRFRIGIAGKKSEIGQKMISGERMKRKNIDDFVLGKFSKEEMGRFKEEIKRGVKAIETALKEGITIAMNKYNAR